MPAACGDVGGRRPTRYTQRDGKRKSELVPAHGGPGCPLVLPISRITEAVAAVDEAEQAARVTGNDQAVQWALWMHAWALLERGDLDAALAAAEESVQAPRRLGPGPDRPRGARRRPRRAGHARARPPADLEPGWRCRWTPPLVRADLALGDASEAAARADQATALAESTPLAGPRAAAGRAQSLVALARGETARAA
jgi:hypothetical protein